MPQVEQLIRRFPISHGKRGALKGGTAIDRFDRDTSRAAASRGCASDISIYTHFPRTACRRGDGQLVVGSPG